MPAVYGARLTTFEDSEKESEYGYVRKVRSFFSPLLNFSPFFIIFVYQFLVAIYVSVTRSKPNHRFACWSTPPLHARLHEHRCNFTPSLYYLFLIISPFSSTTVILHLQSHQLLPDLTFFLLLTSFFLLVFTVLSYTLHFFRQIPWC